MLQKWIIRLGLVNAIVILAASIISYGAAPVHPFRPEPEKETPFYSNLAEELGGVSPTVQAFVRGDSPLANRWIFLTAYGLPVVLSTTLFIALVGLLSRFRDGIDDHALRLLFRWSLAFGVIATLASPVLVRDFWLSVGWGRMTAEGANPYYQDMLPRAVDDLPLGAWRERATYGPLWTLVSGGLMLVGGSTALSAFVVFKVLLLVCWAISLWLIVQLLSTHPPWQRCLGVAIFGWLPMGTQQSLAEGHNDVFMVALLLLWLYFLQRERPLLGTLSLTASFLAKYVAAPLFLLDVLHAGGNAGTRATIGRRILSYWPRLVLAGVATTLALLPFFRSMEFFSSTARMRHWHSLSPEAAVAGLGRITGLPLAPVGRLVPLAFITIAVVAVARYLRRPSPDDFRYACLAILSAVLFGVVGHVWPWFLLWVLAIAALVPGTALSRWVVGLAIIGPFPVLAYSVVYLGNDPRWRIDVPALLMCIFATAWLVLAPRRWFEPTRALGQE